jgi:hypothetical protein
LFVLPQFLLVLLEQRAHLRLDRLVLLFDLVDADVVLPTVVDAFEDSGNGIEQFLVRFDDLNQPRGTFLNSGSFMSTA